MESIDIIKIIIGIIASFSSAGGITWFFGKLTANTLADQYKEKIKHEFGKELESYKTQLDLLKATTLKFNDRQFELYLDLWRNIQELKYATIDLWEELSDINFRNFRNALFKAERQIETSSVLIESELYSDLREIIRILGKFKQSREEFNRYSKDFIDSGQFAQDKINYTESVKDAYLDIVERIRTDIQSKISGRLA